MNHKLGNQTVPVWAIGRLLDEGSLRLPSFQRDAVWDEERAELLWDSLLRGIPLGNLVIARSKNLPSRRIQDARDNAAEKLTTSSALHLAAPDSDDQEFLIDGQQRAIAIRQGLTAWNQGANFRLWIDVDPKKEQKRREHTVQYAFFLCTRGFPWGTGISDAQRRECRDELKKKHPQQMLEEKYPKQIKETDTTLKPDYRLSLSYTWPARASLPMPFATMAGWFLGRSSGTLGLVTDDWLTATALSDTDIQQHVNELMTCKDEPIVAWNIRARWNSNQQKLVTWIRENQEAICRALNRRIYFEVAFEGIDPTQPEELGEAFNRINRLGVRLDGADLFFSALKLQWPEAHNCVWSVYEDQYAGKLLSPPQLVHAAVRLAIADHNKANPDKVKDRLSLSLSDVRSLLDEKSSPTIKSKLEELIKPKSGDDMVQAGGSVAQEPRSVLHELFRRLREALEYKGQKTLPLAAASGVDNSCTAQLEHDDFGLPLPLLARISEKKPYILHNLLLWLLDNRKADTLKEELRHRMVRYALVDYFLLYGNDEYRRQAFQECGQAIGAFPDATLIKLAVDLSLMIKPFKGQQPEEIFISPATFKAYIEDKQDPTNLHDLLLWVQRYYLHKRFPHYDPTLFFNVSALPWDRDHIWPQAKMDGRSIRIAKDAEQTHQDYKGRYLHSFGNLRLLDRRENRGDQDKIPCKKIPCETITDKNAAEKFFAIANDDFYNLALTDNLVTPKFLEDFKVTVNARRVSLYEQLYKVLRLDEVR